MTARDQVRQRIIAKISDVEWMERADAHDVADTVMQLFTDVIASEFRRGFVVMWIDTDEDPPTP
jgi:hypothetical protein